jgi:recombination protein RecA
MSAKEKILSALNKKLGKGAAKVASEGSASEVKEVIPTGIDVLDHHILGCGGLPVGRVGEMFSSPSSGKTSLGFQFLAAAQKAGGLAILLETEDSLMVERSRTFGVDPEEVILVEPDTVERTLDTIVEVMQNLPDDVGPNVLVWDSIAATEIQSQAEALEKKGFGGSGTHAVGVRGKLLSEALPIIARLARQKRTAVVLINQTRDKVGVMFGDTTTTPGGNAVKFHASWRLQMWKGTAVKQGTEVVGQDVTVKAVKNKVSVPQHKAKVRLLFHEGFDNMWSTLDYAKEEKLIAPRTQKTENNYNEAIAALNWKK